MGAPKRVRDAAKECLRRSDELATETVAHALIPPSSPHQIKILDRTSDWLFEGWKAGAYHRDHTHSELSLLDRVHTHVTVPYGPDELETFQYRRIDGDAIYGGLLSHHFGHFLVESTSRLWWPLLNQFKGPIIFQGVGRRGIIQDFASRFFNLLGCRDRVIVTDDTGFEVERLIIPERSFTIKKYWHDLFRTPFLSAGAAAETNWRPRLKSHGEKGLYLSRANYEYRRSFGEKRLERIFADNDYAVVHPEQLPLEEQITLARRHTTIAGIQGSAFHTLLFSDRPKEATYICRDYEVNPNFFMIDALMGNDATYIYNGLAKDAQVTRSDQALIASQYRQDVKLDLDKIVWSLAQRGVIDRAAGRVRGARANQA